MGSSGVLKKPLFLYGLLVEVLQPCFTTLQSEKDILGAAASSSSSSKPQAQTKSCWAQVAQNRHPSSSKQPQSKCASLETRFV